MGSDSRQPQGRKYWHQSVLEVVATEIIHLLVLSLEGKMTQLGEEDPQLRIRDS